jgi:Protein of unknown function (DUF3048) N-terminal domain/Protein of unknown function (DUF3048) C-terminal domain
MLRAPSAVLLPLVVATAALTVCTGGSSVPAGSPVVGSPSLSAAATSTSASPSPSPAPSKSPSKPPAKPKPAGRTGSLYTGVKGLKDGRVLVVKLDNTRNSEPHAGLEKADVVYIEQVEAGLTRYAAVFSTRVPDNIGPIRSARISDIDLFAQYGKVAFAFSGSQHRLHPVIARANLFNVSGDIGPAGYHRDLSRPAPYNFFGNGPELLARAPHAIHAKDVGFRFSTTVPGNGVHIKSATVRWPAATAFFQWNAAAKRWLLTMDGIQSRSDGVRLGGATIVVQYVFMHDSGYGDKFGGRTPMSETIGKGRALVLRNGRAYSARWSRSNAKSGTTWTTPKGKKLSFAPGQVWVLLVNRTTHATLTR